MSVTCPAIAPSQPCEVADYDPHLGAVRGLPGRGCIEGRKTWSCCWPRLPVHGHPAAAPSQLGRGSRCKPGHGGCPRSVWPRPHRSPAPRLATAPEDLLSAACPAAAPPQDLQCPGHEVRAVHCPRLERLRPHRRSLGHPRLKPHWRLRPWSAGRGPIAALTMTVDRVA